MDYSVPFKKRRQVRISQLEPIDLSIAGPSGLSEAPHLGPLDLSREAYQIEPIDLSIAGPSGLQNSTLPSSPTLSSSSSSTLNLSITDSPIAGPSGLQILSPALSQTLSSSSSSTNLNIKLNRLRNVNIENEFIEIENAFKGNLKTFFYKNSNTFLKDICLLLISITSLIADVLYNMISIYGTIKFNVIVECTYIKPVINEYQDRAFKTKNIPLFHSSSIYDIINNVISKICHEEETYAQKGSGWSLNSIDGILIRINKFKPLRGSSYIPLPQKLLTKKCIINPKNNDNYCFKWAILCRYINDLHPERINQRYSILENKFNFKNIEFPTPLKQIKIFERDNNVSINVYGVENNKTIFPLKVCDNEKSEHFDLLLLNENDKYHYCYIKNFNKLIQKQLTKNCKKIEFCKRCLAYFSVQSKKLNIHKKSCGKHKPARIIMPDENLKFKNFHYQFKLPIVAYADFECILKPISTCYPNNNNSFTVANELHEPMSFCVYFVIDDSIPDHIRNQLPSIPYLYRGNNAAQKFMAYLVHNVNLISSLLSKIIPLKMTKQDKIKFKSATHCEMCKREFTLIYRPVKDHCHFSGRFRAALCNDCNLKRQNQKFIPVFIHASSNYDSHFIVRQLGYDIKNIHVIPNSTEKYISFSKKTNNGMNIRFVDTYRFLNRSLAELANNLPRNQFYHTSKFFSVNEMDLVTRKGVYPYEFTDSWKKLELQQLPLKTDFYSSLNAQHISDEDYNHAIRIWNHFEIKTLGEYSDLYLKIDVLLLCDVFENFRSLCHSSYNLDCANYFSIPGFAFDAMLYYTNIELELFSEYETYLFCERGIKGGISMCVKKHSIANNEYIPDTFNPNYPTKFLTYLDANNLYGWAMSGYMPYSDFTWVISPEKLDIFNIPNNSETGYILEVDIEYPQDLHDLHMDLPFLPINKSTNNSKQTKLLTTLETKERYICHYINLKQAISHGLKLTKIHRALKFSQKPWLKPYIDLNTEKRQQANNEFEKDFFKLLNNSVFGKCMENVRKRINLELVSDNKKLLKLIAKPTFKDRIIYDESLCAALSEKSTICLNKPIYVGFAVLELSKTLMYSFHYEIMKKKYGDKISLLYTDTDSFFYEIMTNDFYEDMLDPDLKPFFDTSDYPPNHKCYSLTNKKVIGKFKDECNGIPIKEFIGLRSKLYSFITNDNRVQKKAKGIKKCVIKHEITFTDFKNCLMNLLPEKEKYRVMKLIRSKKHIVNTVTVNKLSLSNTDDKRILKENGVDTIPYGHYSLYNSVNH